MKLYTLLRGPQFDYQFTQLYLWLSTMLSSRGSCRFSTFLHLILQLKYEPLERKFQESIGKQRGQQIYKNAHIYGMWRHTEEGLVYISLLYFYIWLVESMETSPNCCFIGGRWFPSLAHTEPNLQGVTQDWPPVFCYSTNQKKIGSSDESFILFSCLHNTLPNYFTINNKSHRELCVYSHHQSK